MAILISNGPRRPTYIVHAISIFPISEKMAERLSAPPLPTDRPTVPNADATSNSVATRLLFSTNSKIVVETIMIIETIVVKRNAFATKSTGNLRLKAV